MRMGLAGLPGARNVHVKAIIVYFGGNTSTSATKSDLLRCDTAVDCEEILKENSTGSGIPLFVHILLCLNSSRQKDIYHRCCLDRSRSAWRVDLRGQRRSSWGASSSSPVSIIGQR